MGEAANDEQEGIAEQANPVRQRQRTQLPFPYSDLQRAIELCDALATLGGKGAVELTQLAASLNQTAEGGTFRGRTSSARMFGLLETTSDSAQLTELGIEIIDPMRADAAKVAAFLRVPLYSKLYEQYQGHTLPQAAVIQRQMVMLGLPQKQVERARQVFAASVEAARFINSNGRFVKPVTGRTEARESTESDVPTLDNKSEERGASGGGAVSGAGGGTGGNGGGGGKDHPLINGLLVTLPEPGSEWDPEGRKAWLNLADSVFAMIYKQPKGIVPAPVSNEYKS